MCDKPSEHISTDHVQSNQCPSSASLTEVLQQAVNLAITERGFTCNAIARETGMWPATVRYVASGRGGITVRNLERLMPLLGIEFHWPGVDAIRRPSLPVYQGPGRPGKTSCAATQGSQHAGR